MSEQLQNQPGIIPMFSQYKGKKVRWSMDGDMPLFVLSDLCDVLGLKNPSKVAARLDEDEKGVTLSYTPGGVQELLAVNEFGLYAIIQNSRKPEARAFKRWVNHEVLPSIRKTGKYEMDRRDSMLDAHFSWLPQPWKKSVPDALWDNLSRLTGQPWNKENHQRPRNWAGLINKLIYARVPEEVIEAIELANPTKDDGRRDNKKFQHLQERAQGRFAQLVEIVNNVLENSRTMEGAMVVLDQLVPQIRLGEDPIDQKPLFEQRIVIEFQTLT